MCSSDLQLVGEFKLTDSLSLNLRGGYANSQREAPFELFYQYVTPTNASDPFYGQYFNRLDGGNAGDAEFTFSDLNEDLWSAGADLSYSIVPGVTATVGYAYSNTKRRSDRRSFSIRAPSDFPQGVGLLRPDLLIGLAGATNPATGESNYFDYSLIETTATDPAFGAKLRNDAAYAQIQAQITDSISLNAGVRYEDATESVFPIEVFTIPTNSGAANRIKRNYWLPTATITWSISPEMQLRVNASKTIARPQFRELISQAYYDPESNVSYRGNPLLVDSQLYNAEVRYEWYFARDQRFSLAGFYKKIDNPIETYVSLSDNTATTSFANAPTANLYGAELEVQKYVPLNGLGDSSFWASRRFVFVGNYTYTKSKLTVGANDTVNIFGVGEQPASNFFRDGSSLTGQSDHIVNLQFGMEDQDHLSQQTLLLTYASKRVTRRGPAQQPDIIEQPGIHLDFVARQGIKVGGVETELKLEARNITGTKYKEFQQSGSNRVYYNLYDVGRVFQGTLSVKF